MPPFTRLPRPLSRRAFTTTSRRPTSFKSGPAPPRLPREEQEIFERLQKQSSGAFSLPKDNNTDTTHSPSPTSQPSRPTVNQSPDSAPTPASQPSQPAITDSSSGADGEIRFENGKEIRKGDDLHPNMRRGAPPEFEGDVNPKTGEVGGPKNEPLRWGSGEGRGDWSYNGRVTDF